MLMGTLSQERGGAHENMFTLAPEASTGTALGGRTIHTPWAFAAHVAFQAVNSARGLANLPALEGHSCG